MSEIEELRKKIESIARELEELKREIREKKKREEREVKLHDPRGITEALEKELEKVEEGGLFVHAGVIKRKGVCDRWNQDFSLKEALAVHPRRLSKFISPLSSEQRVSILKILLRERPCPVSKIAEETGMEGGELYHHLKELLRHQYINLVERGVYSITPKGEIALIMNLGMAKWFEPPTEEEFAEELEL